MSDNALTVVSNDIFDTREAFEARLVDRSMNFEAEAGFAIQIISGSDYMLKAAYSNRQAVVNAVQNVAAIGLSLNPAKKHAYLVPRKPGNGGGVQVCLDISYMGLIELAVASGSVLWAQAKVVHMADGFEDNGPGALPTHKFNPFAKDRGEIIGVYAVAKLASGDYLSETMSVDDINAIRDRSEAWKSGKTCPWRTDWSEMGKKTVIKRASKYWPKTDRLQQGIHYLNTDGGEGLADLVVNAPAPPAPPAGAAPFDPDAWIRKALVTKTEQELTSVYGQAMADAAKVRDRDGATRFKEAALKHRESIRTNTIDMKEAA